MIGDAGREREGRERCRQLRVDGETAAGPRGSMELRGGLQLAVVGRARRACPPARPSTFSEYVRAGEAA